MGRALSTARRRAFPRWTARSRRQAGPLHHLPSHAARSQDFSLSRLRLAHLPPKDDRHDGRWPQCETRHQPTRFADVAKSGLRPEHRQSPRSAGGACTIGCPVRPVTAAPALLRGMSGQCISCHQRDDIHHNVSPRRGDCHTQQSFAGSVASTTPLSAVRCAASTARCPAPTVTAEQLRRPVADDVH